MTTYLGLCQDVSRESGVVDGVVPTTVVGQTDELAEVVAWTAQAWTDIQNMRSAWLWMRTEWE